MALAVFYYLAIASVMSALLAVTRRNPVHSMLWVLSLFLHVAGIFLLIGAEFLAAVQVIVYAGAILIFYLFIIMLLDVPDEERGDRFGAHWTFAAFAGLGFAALAGVAHMNPLSTGPARAAATGSEGDAVAEIGRALFGPYALPFELASLVLLAAIVGAVVLARKKKEAAPRTHAQVKAGAGSSDQAGSSEQAGSSDQEVKA